MGDTLEVGKLKDISEDFDLERIVVRSDYKNGAGTSRSTIM